MERCLDQKGRWRHKTVAFRVSEEEAKLLDRCVALSGLTKQDYILRRLLQRDVVVEGNPRVYKALRDQMKEIYEELKRIEVEDEEIKKELQNKMEALIKRELYSKYKTAPTDIEREKARQEYLDQRGIPESFRW